MSTNHPIGLTKCCYDVRSFCIRQCTPARMMPRLLANSSTCAETVPKPHLSGASEVAI